MVVFWQRDRHQSLAIDSDEADRRRRPVHENLNGLGSSSSTSVSGKCLECAGTDMWRWKLGLPIPPYGLFRGGGLRVTTEKCQSIAGQH